MRLSKCTDWSIHPLIHSDPQSRLANLPATSTLNVMRFDAFRIDTIIQVWSLFEIKSTQVALLVSGQTDICPSPECPAFVALCRSCFILCDHQPSFCHVPTGIWSFEWVDHGNPINDCTGNGSQRLSEYWHYITLRTSAVQADPVHTLGAQGETQVQLHSFITPALDGNAWSASRYGRCTPDAGDHGAHCIGGWLGSTPGMDVSEKTSRKKQMSNMP